MHDLPVVEEQMPFAVLGPYANGDANAVATLQLNQVSQARAPELTIKALPRLARLARNSPTSPGVQTCHPSTPNGAFCIEQRTNSISPRIIDAGWKRFSIAAPHGANGPALARDIETRP
jgi:hypothetical protein